MTQHDTPHKPKLVFGNANYQVVRAWDETECCSFLSLERNVGYSELSGTAWNRIDFLGDKRIDNTAQRFIREMAEEIERLQAQVDALVTEMIAADHEKIEARRQGLQRDFVDQTQKALDKMRGLDEMRGREAQ